MIVVVDLHDRRPVWAMPQTVPEHLRAVLAEETERDADARGPAWAGPPHEVRVVDVPADGSGDGSARAHPAVLEAVRGAHAYLGYGIPPEVLRAEPGLRWVHSGAAGVGGSLTPELRASEVVFTNSAGIHAEPIAETVLGMLLHFARGLDVAVRAQADRRWAAEAFWERPPVVRELGRSVVGIVGFGGIGRALSRRLAALRAEVLAVRRSPEGAGDVVDGARLLGGREAFGTLLERSDAVVLCAPETPETRGMMDADAFGRMRDGAVFVNVGRGGLVDEAALLDALRRGRLRGAALDVFAREPLPEDHPLWSLPNVLVTPHVSAVTDAYWERETELIAHNLRQLRAGRRPRNVVDPALGY